MRWKCRRGLLELDLLFNAFLDNGYEQLDEEACQRFDQMLDYPDAVLLEWMMGRIHPTDREVASLVEQIRSASTA